MDSKYSAPFVQSSSHFVGAPPPVQPRVASDWDVIQRAEILFDSQTHQPLAPEQQKEAVKALAQQAGRGDSASLEVLIQISVRKDEVGRAAEEIIIGLYANPGVPLSVKQDIGAQARALCEIQWNKENESKNQPAVGVAYLAGVTAQSGHHALKGRLEEQIKAEVQKNPTFPQDTKHHSVGSLLNPTRFVESSELLAADRTLSNITSYGEAIHVDTDQNQPTPAFKENFARFADKARNQSPRPVCARFHVGRNHFITVILQKKGERMDCAVLDTHPSAASERALAWIKSEYNELDEPGNWLPYIKDRQGNVANACGPIGSLWLGYIDRYLHSQPDIATLSQQLLHDWDALEAQKQQSTVSGIRASLLSEVAHLGDWPMDQGIQEID